jgi:hypothetical protein
MAFSKGEYILKNPTKYLGKLPVIYRSSWEISLMKVFDENPAVLGWSSESISIPYRNPLTNKWSMYLPDFFVIYMDKKNGKHAEIIEVKPEKENPFSSIVPKGGQQTRSMLARAINQAKFGAAMVYCQKRGWRFRVMTENDLFGIPGKKRTK